MQATAHGHETILPVEDELAILRLTAAVMPEMNGRDLARNMVALYPRIRRSYVSGYTADVIAHHGVLEEGVHFLQNPAAVADLTAKVREVLDGE